MKSLRVRRRAWFVGVVVGLLLTPFAGSAWATPTSPAPSYPYWQSFTGLACPTTSQCTTVDSTGRETTFHPTGPLGTTIGLVDDDNSLYEVACPSTTVCVAVDSAGGEVTFDPASPGTAHRVALYGGGGLYGLDCPSTSQCTAVGYPYPPTGTPPSTAVTFDPVSSATLSTIQIASSGSGGAPSMGSVACPSAHQCTAVGQGVEATFDPLSNSNVTAQDLPTSGHFLGDVTCPTSSECVTLDFAGGQVEFDPSSPGGATTFDVDPTFRPLGLHCFAADSCTLLAGGEEVGFDPTSPGQPAPRFIGTGPGAGFACPATTQCTSIDSYGYLVTFNPETVGTPLLRLAASAPLQVVACPSTTICTGVDAHGHGTTFTPSTGDVTASFAVDGLAGSHWLSCPTASQCTTVNGNGQATTYDPGSNAGGTTYDIDSQGLRGVACPTTSRCVAVDGSGNALVFDPAAPGNPPQHAVDAGQVPEAIACPTATQCTVVDAAGGMVTFDPTSINAPARIPLYNTLLSVSCPSTSQCTALGSGSELTFDPSTGSGANAYGLGSYSTLTGFDCPSTTQCTAVDNNGGEITFSPTFFSSPTVARLEFWGLNAVACPSVTTCTAVDAGGREVTFDPASQSTPTLESVVAPDYGLVVSVKGLGTVESSPPGDIDCPTACNNFYLPGEPVILTPVASFQWAFAGWSGACTGTGACTVTMNGNRSVKATFTKLPPVRLTVSKSGHGTVTSSPAGIKCGAACSHSFDYGYVTLTAHAAPGYAFAGWSGACAGARRTCNVWMTAPRKVTARFGVAKALTVVKAGTGAGQVKSSPAGISCSATCTHVFAAGTVVTLTASATSSSKFSGWSGACSGTGNCVVTMGVATTVKATFARTAVAPRTSHPSRKR